MVVPIAALLVVTMFVSANWQNEEQGIEVNEKSEELSISHQKNGTYSPANNISATAVTIVNNESELEFKVELMSITVTEEYERIYMELSAEGRFEESLRLQNFKFMASQLGNSQEPYNGLEFMNRHSQINKGKRWPSDRCKSGTYAINPNFTVCEGFDVESNEFSAETILLWEIRSENIGVSYTLQIEAEVGGLPESVSATIYVNIGGGEK